MIAKNADDDTINKIYNKGALAFIPLSYVKELSDAYGVDIDLSFKPDKIQIRISRKNPKTGRLSKSEQHIFKNIDIGLGFTPSTLEIIIRNLLNNWYPDNILST
jgi:hypothetical protein